MPFTFTVVMLSLLVPVGIVLAWIFVSHNRTPI
jgi:hypothetical protein